MPKKGYKWTNEHHKNHSENYGGSIGKHWKLSLDIKEKLSKLKMGSKNPNYDKYGKDNPTWRGGSDESYKRQRDKYKSIKRQVFEHYGLKCKCCGENTFDFLTLDHIDGSGSKHNKIIKKGNTAGKLYNWLVKNNFPKTYPIQTLCFNCNIGKGRYGECPHKRHI